MRNLKSQIAKLVQRSTTTLKILYFSGGNQFFQILLGLKSIYNRGRKSFLFIGQGGIIWDWEGNISKIIHRGSHRGASHQDTWTGCLYGTQIVTLDFQKIPFLSQSCILSQPILFFTKANLES